MAAFFSGTDTGTIDASSEFEWLVSLVANKSGEMVARADIYQPRLSHEIRAILPLEPTKGGRKFTKADEKAARAEVAAKVKTPKYAEPKWGKSGHWYDDITPWWAREHKPPQYDRRFGDGFAPITHGYDTSDEPRYLPEPRTEYIYEHGV